MKYINFFLSVLYLSSTILVISCSSDEDTDGLMVSSDDTTDDSSSTDDQIITDHEFQTNSNSGVYSLLMTTTEYADWIDNDVFREGAVRNLIFEDIYKKFPDEYDFIFLVFNEPSISEGIGYYGKLIGVSNAVEGTGESNYNYSSDFGFEGKLKAVMQLTGLSYLQSGPWLHELMHNWGTLVLKHIPSINRVII